MLLRVAAGGRSSGSAPRPWRAAAARAGEGTLRATRCLGAGVLILVVGLATAAERSGLATAAARSRSVTDAARPETIAIRAGTLIDTGASISIPGAVILVQEGKIKAAGPGIQVPAGAEVIDLGVASVLPGLFDVHTHLCIRTAQPAGETPRDLWAALLFTTLSDTTGYRAIQGVAAARSYLESGFTTVRDVGNAGNYADTDLRRAIEQGLVPGPTILNAGRIIAPYGGQFPSTVPRWMQEMYGDDGSRFIGVLQPDGRNLGAPEYLYADTRDEMKKAVRENVFYGAKVIKIVVDDHPYMYTVDDIRFIVEEAARAGRKVAAHCGTDEGARRAAEAGVASIEHGFLASEETLRLARRNGVVLVGTDFPEALARQMKVPETFTRTIIERLKRARRAGVTMAFGTDIFMVPPGHTYGTLAAEYIDVFLAVGMTPAEILRMMTTNAAHLLGVEKERGAIRPGLAADIIATPRNPLEDIRALREVSFVMKDGKVFRRTP